MLDLIADSQKLGATLEVSRRTTPPPAFPGAGQMSADALDHYRALLRRAAAGESLSEREHGQLDALRSVAQGQVVLPPVSQPDDAGGAASPLPKSDEDQSGASNAAALDPGPAPNPTALRGPSEAGSEGPTLDKCRYCGQSPCCGPDHHAYRTLHYEDPIEVARRSKEATAVMLHQIGRGVRW